jgi:cytochrome P450
VSPKEFDCVTNRLRQYGKEYSDEEKMAVESFDFMLSVGEGLTTNMTRMVHHLLSNEECFQKLREELDAVDSKEFWRDPKVLNLEYLVSVLCCPFRCPGYCFSLVRYQNGCVREAIRLNLPDYVRVSRKCPEPVVYGETVIPALVSTQPRLHPRIPYLLMRQRQA